MQKRKTPLGIILVAIMLSTFLLIRPVVAEEKGYQDISVQQARRMINHNSRNLVILDVRNQSEYDLGHLYDAILMPVYEVENSSVPIELPQPLANNGPMMDVYLRVNSSFKLSTHINDNIIVYCAGGQRSAQACQILVEHGFTKVCNMLGGINAWMQADYPIYTSNHHVTVDFADYSNKIQFDIEPLLLYQENCTSCQNQNLIYSGSSTPTNVTATVLEEGENHTLLLIAQNINDTVIYYTVNKTLLWRYNELENKLNRTITLTSIIVTKDDKSTQVFRLSDDVEHEDYNMTLSTILYPLDQNTYNSSFTAMNYAPTGKTEIRSSEWVDFNEPLTWSQLYTALGKVANELANEYKKSKDENLKQFSKRYCTMANEAKLLSTVIKTHLSDYDKTILENSALIMDDWVSEILCWLCSVGCQAALLFGCFGVCACTGGLACTFCWIAVGALEEVRENGCELFCYLLGCSTWVSDPDYNYVTGTTEYEYYAYITNHEYLRGNSIDNNYAHIYVPNPPGMGQIIGTFDEEYVHGSLQIYGKSGSGYYSDLYVYVSLDNQNWNYVGFRRVTSTSPYWIDLGYIEDCFKYICIVGYDSGFSVSLYLDCVRVTP